MIWQTALSVQKYADDFNVLTLISDRKNSLRLQEDLDSGPPSY